MNYNTAVGIVLILVLMVGLAALFIEYQDYEVGPQPQIYPGEALRNW